MSSLNQLDSSDKRPLYRRVESYIESLIQEEGIEPGHAIPSLAQLKKTLDVNALTVQRAIRELTAKRVLVTLQGKGTFVAEGAVKRILWVSAEDLSEKNINTFSGDLFFKASRECQERRVKLDPVWLRAESPFDAAINAHGGESAVIGYIFSGCLPEHRLLRHVMQSGRPFVNISATHFGRPRCAYANFPQGNTLAFDYFRKKGISRVAVLMLGENFDHYLEDPSFEVDVTSLQDIEIGSPGRARAEEQGYVWGQRLVSQISSWKGQAIYISDDVAARGVTRALLQSIPGLCREIEIVVRCSREAIISLGIPVTYVVFDTGDLASQAVEMLLAQAEGRDGPQQYYSDYRILKADASGPKAGAPIPVGGRETSGG